MTMHELMCLHMSAKTVKLCQLYQNGVNNAVKRLQNRYTGLYEVRDKIPIMQPLQADEGVPMEMIVAAALKPDIVALWQFRLFCHPDGLKKYIAIISPLQEQPQQNGILQRLCFMHLDGNLSYGKYTTLKRL